MQPITHKITATFFLLFFLVNILLPSLILINFKINQEYISENLCVEKDIELSSCKGNCQLMKNLDKIDKGVDSDTPNSTRIESHITSLYYSAIEFSFAKSEEVKSDILLDNQDKVKAGYTKLPFQPPILL